MMVVVMLVMVVVVMHNGMGSWVMVVAMVLARSITNLVTPEVEIRVWEDAPKFLEHRRHYVEGAVGGGVEGGEASALGVRGGAREG